MHTKAKVKGQITMNVDTLGSIWYIRTNVRIDAYITATSSIKRMDKKGVHMNKEWSDLNKALQSQLKCENTFALGLDTLIELRRQLMDELYRMKRELRVCF